MKQVLGEISLTENLEKIQSEDRILSWVIVGTMLLLLFRVTILLQLFDDSHIFVMGYKYVVVALFCFGLKIIFRRSLFFAIKTYLAFSIIYILQVLLFPENKEYIDKDIFYTIVVCMPMFVYVYSINDYELLFDTFKKAIPLALVLEFIYCYLVMKDGMTGESNAYNMSAGFTFMPFALTGFAVFFKEKSAKYFVISVLMSLGILMVGSRGPILWIALYVFWKLLSKFHVVMRVVLCATVGIMGLFFRDIVTGVNLLLDSFGIYSRTLYLLENGITEGSGRWELYEQGIQIIGANWFVGAGLGCDRAIHSYIHNFFLEIWMDFGIILGTVFILFFFYLMIRSFMLCKLQHRDCLEVMFFVGFMPLTLSGSYYTDFHFYIFMGVVLGILSKATKNRGLTIV